MSMTLESLYAQDMLATPLIIPIIIWTLIWQGIAMWHAARNKQMAWFVALLFINTSGLLPLAYLAFFQKKDNWIKKISRE